MPSGDFDRRFRPKKTGGARSRQMPIGAHEGDARDFLRRYERAAAAAARGSKKRRRKFAAECFKYASDPRMHFTAIEHLTRHGEKAPGPNGLRLERLDQHERWELAQGLSQAMRSDAYQPGPTRTTTVPKYPSGTRTITIPNAEDKVVQRTLVQTLQPLLDPNLEDNTIGFRPGLGRDHALIRAELQSQIGDNWITEDLADAFGSVPHGRALDIFRMHGFAEDMLGMLDRILRANCRRGFGQGSVTGPLWMNAYGDHHIDKPIRRWELPIILIRWADDLLVICRAGADPQEVYRELEHLVLPTGMKLKGAPERSIRQLQAGMTADWLGYEVGNGDRGLTVRLGPKCWNSLLESLTLAHEQSAPPLAAVWAIRGWVDQLGPCFPHQDRREVIRGIGRCARELGFREIPSFRELTQAWERAHQRFCSLRRAMLIQSRHLAADGFARRHSSSADTSRGGGGLVTESPPPPLRDSKLPKLTIYTDGSCQGSHGVGGWAFVREGPEDGQRFFRSDSHPRATNNRMELTAVLRALRSLDRRCHVTLFCDSTYVVQGIDEHLPIWRANGWRRGGKGSRKQIANLRLWQRLDAELQRHIVECRWVPSHSGVDGNEECDRLARDAVRNHIMN